MFIAPREIMRRIDAGGARESRSSYCLVTALRKLPISTACFTASARTRARSNCGLKLWQVIIMPYNEIIARGVQVIRLKLRKNSVYYLTAHSSDCSLWYVMKHIINCI